MPREKRVTFRLVLLSAAFSAVVCEDLFGMRLTTETLKTKESTHYRFHYFVKDEETGDYKTQEETKEGDSVRGSYTLAEPNGDLRTVTYRAGPGTGFEAKVDVHPSGSPMKQTTEQTAHSTATSQAKTEKTTLESNVKRFPGGFVMDITKKPQSDFKTEMGMKFTLNTDFPAEPVTNAVTALESKTTEKPETTTEPMTTLTESFSENLERSRSENSTENTTATEDPIEKEIEEIEKFMPKLPDIVLSDNKTHFKFYKDPEEALLDERITQIARQLAETSLRREYEERKLGHFIPISVTSVHPTTSSHLSKSIKFKDGAPNFRPLHQPPLQVLAEVQLIPQYIYKETVIPKFLPAGQRLPVIQTSVPFQINGKWDPETYETVTNVPDLLKLNKTESQTKEINATVNVKEGKLSTNYETTERAAVSVLPIKIPTLLQFFSPYVAPTQRNPVTEMKTQPPLPSVTTAQEDLATVGVPLNTDPASPPTTTVNVQNVTKS